MVKSHDLTQKMHTTHLSSLVTSVGDITESIAGLHAEVRRIPTTTKFPVK